jgi:hypothetical protein
MEAIRNRELNARKNYIHVNCKLNKTEKLLTILTEQQNKTTFNNQTDLLLYQRRIDNTKHTKHTKMSYN